MSGPPSGEAVLLLHGIPEGAEYWRTVLTRLGEAGFSVYAPDMPGYGLSRFSKDTDYSLSGAAELFAGWLREQRISPVWVVGHDLGGAVAQMLVVRHPDLVARVTLTHAPVERSWPVTPVRLFRFAAKLGLYAPMAAARMVPNPYAWWAVRRGFADPAGLDSATAARVFWDGKVRDPRGRLEFSRHLTALDNMQTQEIAPRLREVKIPTLLMWGKDDRYQPWETVGLRLKELLPHADVALIDGAGHFGILEKSEAYLEALLAWRRSRL